MASIGIGFLGEPSLAELLEPIFGGLSHAVAVALSVAIAFAIVTAVHISVGEQVAEDAGDQPRRAHRPPRLRGRSTGSAAVTRPGRSSG